MKNKLFDGYFTIKQAAKYKKMEYEAFRYYCHKERGPAREMFAGRWVYSKEALDAWDKNKA